MKYYKLHVVLGNNSADLDSCIGSILLSYYMNTIQKENQPLTYHIPLINEHSQSFRSRFEVCDLLGPLIDQCIFRD